MKSLHPASPQARLIDRLQDLCLIAILLAAPLVFYTHGHDVFELNKITVVRVMSALAAMLFMARLLLVRPLVWVRSPLDWPLLAFLGVSLICTFHTANWYLSVDGVYEDFEGITTLVMYVFLAVWVQQHVKTRRQINLFIGAVILAGTLAGFYGILQNFQIDFVPWNPATYSKNRLFATMGNPNFLAAYLVMSLPLTFMVFLDIPSHIKTIAAPDAAAGPAPSTFAPRCLAALGAFLLLLAGLLAAYSVGRLVPALDLQQTNNLVVDLGAVLVRLGLAGLLDALLLAVPLILFFGYFGWLPAGLRVWTRPEGKSKRVAVFILFLGLEASLGLMRLFQIDYLNFTPSLYDATSLGGMFLSQKFLAAHFIVIFPLIAAVLFYFGWIKIIFAIAMIFEVVAIEFTKSRGGFGSIVAFGLVLAAFFGWEIKRKSEVLRRNRGWLVSFFVILLLSYAYPPIRETVNEMLGRVFALFSPKNFTLTPRLYIWRSALQMLKDHFWFGTGLDTFQVVFPKYRMALYWILEWNGTPEKAHNVILQTAATMGILGLTAFFWILAAYTRKTLQALWRVDNPSGRLLVAGGFAAVLAFFVQDCFSFTVVGYGSLFWMLMGLVPAMERVYTGKSPAEERQAAQDYAARDLPALHLPGLAVICALLFVFAWHSTRIWVADSFYKQGQVGIGIGRWDYAVNMYQKAAGRLGKMTPEQVAAAGQVESLVPVPVTPGLNPDQELYWVKLGIAYENAAAAQEKPEQKENLYTAALMLHQHTVDMNPINGYNYNNKGRVLKTMGETLGRRDYLEKAIQHYDKAISLDPNNVYFNLDLANCYLDLSQWQKGIDLCHSLTERFPDFAVPYSYAAFIQMRLNQSDQAIGLFKTALAKDWKGDDASRALAATNLGTLLVAKHRTQEAVEAYQAAVDSNPGLPEAWSNLGSLQAQLGRKDQAVASFRKVLEISKDNATALQMLKKLGAQ